MVSEFQMQLASSSLSNFLLVCLFGVGVFVKARLQKSRCAVHNSCFDCESQLLEIKRLEQKIEVHQDTNREFLVHLKESLSKIGVKPLQPGEI